MIGDLALHVGRMVLVAGGVALAVLGTVAMQSATAVGKRRGFSWPVGLVTIAGYLVAILGCVLVFWGTA